MSQRLKWVLDIDIEKYFDSIPHSHLRDFLDRRVTDGVIRRMIDKWLKAGVLEDGLLHHATEGSPQGGVISPCLSNIFRGEMLALAGRDNVRIDLGAANNLVVVGGMKLRTNLIRKIAGLVRLLVRHGA